MFRISLKDAPKEELDIDDLVRRTEGFSGADINSLCRDASFVQMRKKIKK